MLMLKFYDTNALLLMQDEVFKDDVYISPITFIELEEIKTNKLKDEDIKYKARRMSKLLLEHENIVHVCDYIADEDKKKLDLSKLNNDYYICSNANGLQAIEKYKGNGENVLFISNDLNCRHIAKNIYHLQVSDVPKKSIDISYTGFKEVQMDDDEMAEFYSDLCNNRYNLLLNQYIIIKDKTGNVVDKYRWNGEEHKGLWHKDIKSMYFDKLKTKDIYQTCAVDSIVNNTLTAISGKAGSGKSLIALMVAMNLIERGIYDRLVVLFNPTKTRGAADMGYIPGTSYEKAMGNFVGNVLTTKFGDKYAVDILVSQNKLKLVSMADARGMEIMDNEILWITEAQNTSVDLIKLCLSRMSSGAKAIIEGDYEAQLDNRTFEGDNNGLRRIITAFKGQKEFGYVELQNVWRSRIAQLCELL